MTVRRHLALLLSLGASLTLAVGCSGGDTVSLESVAQAATKTQAAGSSRMAMVVSMTMEGKRADLVAEGAFDYKRSRGWMDMDLGGLGPLGAVPTPGGVVRILIDGDTVFMRLPPSLRSATGGRPWGRTSAGSGALVNGMSQPDPSSMLESLRGLSDSLENAGRVRVRGVPTTHYRATVDMAKALAQAGAAERAQAEAMLKFVGGLDEIPVELYIDDADRVRRMEMKYEFKLMNQTMTMEFKMELFDFGEPVKFKRPASHEVAELSSALGSGR